jgi:hypothetical protein
VTPNDGESEAETIMTDHHERGGDAASELRKVVEDRQKRSVQMENARSHQRILNTSNSGNFKTSAISPVSMPDSNYRLEGNRIRCVCSRNEPDEDNGYMVQWYVVTPSPPKVKFSRSRLLLECAGQRDFWSEIDV